MIDARTRAAVARYASPLRYPGGKATMAPFLSDLFDAQVTPMDVEIWIEPFAGGAGAALSMLASNRIGEAWLFEANPALAAFWRALLGPAAEDLVGRVRRGQDPTLGEFYAARERVHEVIAAGEPVGQDVLVDVALAALVVNRCSRSGIIGDPGVGPIGGRGQGDSGAVAARWAASLPDRLQAVTEMAERIRFTEGDGIGAVESLAGCGFEEEAMIFADPPYIQAGPGLYSRSFGPAEHERLAAALAGVPDTPWLLTYDAHPEVLRLYPENVVMWYEIRHHATTARTGIEYAVMGPSLRLHEVTNPVRPSLNQQWVPGREPWWWARGTPTQWSGSPWGQKA